MKIVKSIVEHIVMPLVGVLASPSDTTPVGPTIPTLALRDRFNEPILDRSGNYIESRV